MRLGDQQMPYKNRGSVIHVNVQGRAQCDCFDA